MNNITITHKPDEYGKLMPYVIIDGKTFATWEPEVLHIVAEEARKIIPAIGASLITKVFVNYGLIHKSSGKHEWFNDDVFTITLDHNPNGRKIKLDPSDDTYWFES